jgi:O-acetyl-ADP-ribose deacetylase (regulator of RNase III)
VGPVYWRGGASKAEVLASCHTESIRIAEKHGISSIAFPAISTGAFGYPVHEAAPIALSSAASAMADTHNVRTCRFVLFDVSTVRAFERAAEKFQKSNPSVRIEKAYS